jgi:hypothetical protein
VHGRHSEELRVGRHSLGSAARFRLVPQRPRRHVQRQRSVPPQPRADDGRLSAVEDGNGRFMITSALPAADWALFGWPCEQKREERRRADRAQVRVGMALHAGLFSEPEAELGGMFTGKLGN